MSESRRRHDPLALLVHGVAVALIAAVALYLLFALHSQPPAEPTRLAKALDELVASVRQQPQPKPAAAPRTKTVPAPAGPTSGPLMPEAGRTWRYAVQVEPRVWRDITLTYRTLKDGEKLAVQADFRHAGGTSSFRLGTLVAGDPAHASSRFPGFFLHAAYIEFPLRPGQAVTWRWPWREPNQPARPGRVKRYDGTVTRWEMLEVPAGRYNTVRIDAKLHYVEDGRVQATVRETLWIAPKVQQVVRVEREGRSPDEAAQRIVAELVEFH